MVIGYLRPVILVPVGLIAGLPGEQMEAILLHELAHVRRHDYLINLLQVFVEGLLFYHPATWWISGTIRAERENCCDDLVVSLTGGRLVYAKALTALEGRRASLPGLAIAASEGGLLRRIRRLIGKPDRRFAAIMPIPMAALLIAVGAAGVAAWQQPKQPAARDATPVQEQPIRSAPHSAMESDQPKVAPGRIWVAGQPGERPVSLPISQASTIKKLLRALDLPLHEVQPPAYIYRTAADGQRRREIPVRLEEILSGNKPDVPLLPGDVVLFTSGTENAGNADKAAEKLNLETSYRKWLSDDVAYIISDEERKAFRAITTDPERAQFVEQFWLRRDPTPGTPVNEFKAEHYHRIAYANEHFSAESQNGWMTDRGRIYIEFGPPDGIESNAGRFRLPATELWHYKHIDGMGHDINISFATRDGDLRLTSNPPIPSAK